MGYKKLRLSIIVPLNEKESSFSRDKLVLALAEISYYVEKCGYNSSEIILTGKEKENISGLAESYKSVIPEILSFSEEEVGNKIKGDAVVVIKPNRKISLESFEKLVDVFLKEVNKDDIFVPFKKRKSLCASFLNWKTFIFEKILRFNNKVKVIKNPEIICFSPEIIRDVSFFNLLKTLVFKELDGYKIRFVDMADDVFLPKFLDYLKTWQAMFVFALGKLKNKILKRDE
jgi:hypothetical protein